MPRGKHFGSPRPRERFIQAIGRALPALPALRTLDLSYNNLTEAADFSLRSYLRTASESTEAAKLLPLDVVTRGNVCDEGFSTSDLSRSKLNAKYRPAAHYQDLPADPFVKEKPWDPDAFLRAFTNV